MSKEKYESPNPRRSHTFMSTEDQASGKRSTWYELAITGFVHNVSPVLFRLQHLTSLYLNDNYLTHIPPDIAKLTHLTYLDLSSNKLRTLPSEIGDMIHLRELLLNYNYLRTLPYELGKLFQLQKLALKGNPLSSDIINIYNDRNGTSNLLNFMLDNLAVTATTPPQRQWIPLAHPERNRPTAFFTVMCYNVLCDKYCTRQLYGYCPSWALNWEFRKKGIMEEIKNYSADIISLQEVETEQFFNFFLPELKQDGYDGIFSPKSRARTMTEQERKHVDGCAIFFRTSKFSLVKEHLIEFNQLAMANAEGSDEMLNRVMTKDNIGLAAMLETKEGAYENVKKGSPQEGQLRQQILVATAHIHWDPEFSDVKLIQTMMLMWQLKNIIEESQQLVPSSQGKAVNTPLILCGDLNSLPNSGVVEYLTDGKVSYTHTDFKEMDYASCLQKLNFTDNKEALTHDFRLGRAYDNDVMPQTNYTFDFKGLIDYIFYSRDFMNCLGVLGPLEDEWFKENKILGCPHPHVPSDHFSLFVELELPLVGTGNRNLTNNKLR